MRELLELRTRLSDLVGSLQGNDKLEGLLQELSGDEEKLKQLRTELDKQAAADGGSDG
jgi:type VI secretion system protein ImpB